MSTDFMIAIGVVAVGVWCLLAVVCIVALVVQLRRVRRLGVRRVDIEMDGETDFNWPEKEKLSQRNNGQRNGEVETA